MPLLVVALITHVLYKAMTKGWDWGTDTSSRAWQASMAGSQKAADKLRARMAAKLDEWAADPGSRGYAAFGLRAAGKVARGLGKAGVWTALKGAKATGSVVRTLGGGALATGGLLGALAQSVRDGAKSGSDWWSQKAKKKSPRATAWADKLRNWGNTIPGQATPGPTTSSGPRPDAGPEEAPRPGSGPGPKTGTTWENPQAGPGGMPPPSDNGQTDQPREPFIAGEATVGDPVKPPAPPLEIAEELYDGQGVTPIGPEERDRLKKELWGIEPDEDLTGPGPMGTPQAGPPTSGAGQASTPDATPVGSTTAAGSATGAATAVLDRTDPEVIEGEVMSTGTGLVPLAAGTQDVAPISNAADGMQYEQALLFLQEQARRAQELAEMVEQVNALQRRVQSIAKVMTADNQVAEDALSRFRVSSPGLTEATGLLGEVAGDPAPQAALIAAYMALDAVTAACHSAQANLVARFGHAWEVMKSENADGQFLNN